MKLSPKDKGENLPGFSPDTASVIAVQLILYALRDLILGIC